jgi:predicted XRE-type DNA-binding protein
VDIRQIIIDRMAQKRINQAQLSELTGLMRPRINAYLRGHRGFTDRSLTRMFEALDLEIRPVRPRKGR